MTDLGDKIAAVQREHRLVTRMVGRKAEKSCLCGWRSPERDCTFTDHPEHVADAVIREVLTPELPVTITTTEQLDELPFLTVIRELRPPRRGIDYGGIYERRTSGWQCIAGTWVEPERNGGPMLPVVVLWRGKDAE